VRDSLMPSLTPDVFDGDVLAMPCIAENRLVLVISAHDNLFIYSIWPGTNLPTITITTTITTTSY
jgi:hypothetical protein